MSNSITWKFYVDIEDLSKCNPDLIIFSGFNRKIPETKSDILHLTKLEPATTNLKLLTIVGVFLHSSYYGYGSISHCNTTKNHSFFEENILFLPLFYYREKACPIFNKISKKTDEETLKESFIFFYLK
jgi:hypothetical protein